MPRQIFGRLVVVEQFQMRNPTTKHKSFQKMIQNFLTSQRICILPLCLNLYQKIWNAFHEWFKLSLCSQREGLYIELPPKNTYILGSETVFNCYLQGPSMFALQFGFCFREWGNDCPTAVVEKIIFQPPFWKGSDLILSVFCLWKIHRTITLYFYVQRVWVS